MIIFIDNAVNKSIAKETILTLNNTDKFSLKLVKASAYLSQFSLNIKCRPRKEYNILGILL